MNELLRYIWLHGTERAASEWLVYTILFLVALGSVIKSKLFFLRDVEAIVAAVVVSAIANLLLFLSAVLPNSPLLGATGTLFPSPWLNGLFQSLCIEAVVVSLVFGLLAGTVRSASDVLTLMTYGISKWSWAVLLALLVSFFIND